MTELVITGAGSGLCDSILEAIEAIEGDYRLRLVDSMESAGEVRRFQGRTVVIELDTEAILRQRMWFLISTMPMSVMRLYLSRRPHFL